MEYRKRIVDDLLAFRIKSKGAVVIEGCKWCGKTTSASIHANSDIHIDDPARRDDYLKLSLIDPEFLLEGETPRLIDEWQLAPRLWDAVRYEVDKRGEFGQFILTGSSVPEESEEILHSGIGRIVSFKMRPMSLYESGESTGEVSLASLFEGESIKGRSDLSLRDIAFLVARGGWPMSLQSDKDVALQQAKDFYAGLIERDIHKASKEGIDKKKYDFFMKSYARNVGTLASLSKIAYGLEDEEGLSRITAAKYLSLSERIFVIEEVEAYSPHIRSRNNLRTESKRYFVDPSLASSALRAAPNKLMMDLKAFGFFFENLVMRDLRVYCETLGGEIFHYRDKNDLECDAVISLDDGRYGLIEIKLASEGVEKAAISLAKVRNALVSGGAEEPSFLAIIVGVGEYAYRLEDGTYVIPIGTLKN